MNKILEKKTLAKNIVELVVEAPRVAAKAQPGHFIIAMADEQASGFRSPSPTLTASAARSRWC